jgi:hypothetical protein
MAKTKARKCGKCGKVIREDNWGYFAGEPYHDKCKKAELKGK